MKLVHIPNPSRPAVTDRALRYRAQRNPPPGARVCHYCGSDRNVEIEHVDGREENCNPENLTWACRSCNTRKGAYFARYGIGRKTRQYNPARGRGARTLRSWLNAVDSVQGAGGTLEPAEAIAVIQATPHARRLEFARELARVKALTLARRNPQEIGPHGPVFRQFYHDAAGAVAMLKALKTGEAVAALYHPEVGDIDLIWGKPGAPAKDFRDGYGLSHILARKDRAAVAANLQSLLLGMWREAEPSRRGTDEIRLTDGRHVAIVSLVWQPSKQHARTPKRWLLTAFYAARKGNGKAIRRKDLDVSGARAGGTTLPPGGSVISIDQAPPRSNPDPSYEQYLWAVGNHARGAHDEGGAVIHATSFEARRRYAKKIWEARRFHGTDRLTGRRGRDEVPF
jgi:hypothetical protein